MGKNKKRRKAPKVKTRGPAERREEFLRVLAALGLLEEFYGLSPDVQRFLMCARLPRLSFRIDPTLQDDPLAGKIKGELERAMAGIMCEDAPLGPGCTLQDLVTIAMPLAGVLHEPDSDPLPMPAAALEHFRDATRPIQYGGADLANTLFADLVAILWKHYRHDSATYYILKEDEALPFGRWAQLLILKKATPERINLKLDGEWRPAFRCGIGGAGRLCWVEWSSEQLGIDGPERMHPVFIQSHAVKNLEKRLAVEGLSTNILHRNMVFCLGTPEITCQGAGSYLAEYWLGAAKVGYFAANMVDDKIIVKTFLFLTMDGTPEGRRLNQLLGLSRNDKRWLNMDNLNAFVMTDLTRYPDIRTILTQCGCGHLVDLAAKLPWWGREGQADFVRKFLQLESRMSRGGRLLNASMMPPKMAIA